MSIENQQSPVGNILYAMVEGEIRYVDYNGLMPTGTRPRAFCLECKGEMVFRIGEKNAHSFAHLPGTESGCSLTASGEGLDHFNAKHKVILYLQNLTDRRIKVMVPCRRECTTWYPVVIAPGPEHLNFFVVDFCSRWEKIQAEMPYFNGSVVFDIGIESARGIGAIEIYKTHRVDYAKAELLKAHKIPWVEINADYINNEWDGKDIPKISRSPQFVNFICESCRKREEKQKQKNGRYFVDSSICADSFYVDDTTPGRMLYARMPDGEIRHIDDPDIEAQESTLSDTHTSQTRCLKCNRLVRAARDHPLAHAFVHSGSKCELATRGEAVNRFNAQCKLYLYFQEQIRSPNSKPLALDIKCQSNGRCTNVKHLSLPATEGKSIHLTDVKLSHSIPRSNPPSKSRIVVDIMVYCNAELFAIMIYAGEKKESRMSPLAKQNIRALYLSADYINNKWNPGQILEVDYAVPSRFHLCLACHTALIRRQQIRAAAQADWDRLTRERMARIQEQVAKYGKGRIQEGGEKYG